MQGEWQARHGTEEERQMSDPIEPPPLREDVHKAMYDLNKELADDLRGRVTVRFGKRFIGTKFGCFVRDDAGSGVREPACDGITDDSEALFGPFSR